LTDKRKRIHYIIAVYTQYLKTELKAKYIIAKTYYIGATVYIAYT